MKRCRNYGAGCNFWWTNVTCYCKYETRISKSPPYDLVKRISKCPLLHWDACDSNRNGDPALPIWIKWDRTVKTIWWRSYNAPLSNTVWSISKRREGMDPPNCNWEWLCNNCIGPTPRYNDPIWYYKRKYLPIPTRCPSGRRLNWVWRTYRLIISIYSPFTGWTLKNSTIGCLDRMAIIVCRLSKSTWRRGRFDIWDSVRTARPISSSSASIRTFLNTSICIIITLVPIPHLDAGPRAPETWNVSSCWWKKILDALLFHPLTKVDGCMLHLKSCVHWYYQIWNPWHSKACGYGIIIDCITMKVLTVMVSATAHRFHSIRTRIRLVRPVHPIWTNQWWRRFGMPHNQTLSWQNSKPSRRGVTRRKKPLWGRNGWIIGIRGYRKIRNQNI